MILHIFECANNAGEGNKFMHMCIKDQQIPGVPWYYHS